MKEVNLDIVDFWNNVDYEKAIKILEETSNAHSNSGDTDYLYWLFCAIEKYEEMHGIK